MAVKRFRFSRLASVAFVVISLTSHARAQLIIGNDSLIGKLNPFHVSTLSQPVDVPVLCKQLDCLSERLRDDGLVVVKQPDVFSQARMTHFRNDFEQTMVRDLNMFHLVLSARINRLDAATTTQTTSLSGALAAPGSSTVHLASGATAPNPPTGPPSVNSSATPTSLDTTGAFGKLGVDTNVPNPNAALALGVDPTVYLDEKKRFLEHLNQIRRISRDPADLVAQMLNAHHRYPDGAVLFLGTMFAPTQDRGAPGQGFTHKVGDVVTVGAPKLGRLVNRMERTDACEPWIFGTAALMRNLAGRGLL